MHVADSGRSKDGSTRLKRLVKAFKITGKRVLGMRVDKGNGRALEEFESVSMAHMNDWHTVLPEDYMGVVAIAPVAPDNQRQKVATW